MTKFTVEKYNILSVEQIRLLDEDGVYWYPLKNFFKNVLFRELNITNYRDNEEYSKYMKVIEYKPLKTFNDKPLKTWFINNEGMFLILKNTFIIKDTPKKTLMREKYLAAARNFFGVTVTNDEPTFLSYQPDLSNYDVWSILCLTQDKTIKKETIWKKCEKCGFYYPCSKNYFTKYKTQYSSNCKQCSGNDFKCSNKIIQYIYNHDGLDLLYNYYLGDNDKIIEELNNWIGRGGV